MLIPTPARDRMHHRRLRVFRPPFSTTAVRMAEPITDTRTEVSSWWRLVKNVVLTMLSEYAMPNDDIENERLGKSSLNYNMKAMIAQSCLVDLQHHLFLYTFENKLGLAPPNDANAKVKRVLDLGTGTGIWALDYADEHPEAEVNVMGTTSLGLR